MSRTMMVVAMAMMAMMGCGEERDGGGGCERPEGPPTPDADYCLWGPRCGECALPGEVGGYYEASDDGCTWVEMWRQRPEELTREQYERQSVCNAAQDGYDRSEGTP